VGRSGKVWYHIRYSVDGAISAEAAQATILLDKMVVGKRVYWILSLCSGQATISLLADELVQGALATFFPEKWLLSDNNEVCL
jgi:hypothetical protein